MLSRFLLESSDDPDSWERNHDNYRTNSAGYGGFKNYLIFLINMFIIFGKYEMSNMKEVKVE